VQSLINSTLIAIRCRVLDYGSRYPVAKRCGSRVKWTSMMQDLRKCLFRLQVRSAIGARRQMRLKIFKFLLLQIIVKVLNRPDSIFVARVHSGILPVSVVDTANDQAVSCRICCFFD
jgi:hypothetical protein